MGRRIKTLNLRIEDIKLEDLEKILLEIDHCIAKYLAEELPPKTDYDLLLRVEKNDEITLYIDIGVIGGYEDLVDYKRIVDNVVDVARKVFEKEIEKYRREQRRS